jgi:hypothetical protein
MILDRIREKRKFHFSNKRITPTIIRDLASVFEKELKVSTEGISFYSVDAKDNSSYESRSIIIFIEEGILAKKSLHKVIMRFNTGDFSKSMEVQILNTADEKSQENYIVVSGDDPIWVNGVISGLSEIISNAENQPQNESLINGIALVTGILLIVEYFRIFYNPILHLESEWIKLALILGVPMVIFIYSSKLGIYINELWPSVELQTGPEYKLLPAKKRKILISWIAAIGLSLIAAVIYDLFSSN